MGRYKHKHKVESFFFLVHFGVLCSITCRVLLIHLSRRCISSICSWARLLFFGSWFTKQFFRLLINLSYFLFDVASRDYRVLPSRSSLLLFLGSLDPLSNSLDLVHYYLSLLRSDMFVLFILN
jgi:hypothetical protein